MSVILDRFWHILEQIVHSSQVDQDFGCAEVIEIILPVPSFDAEQSLLVVLCTQLVVVVLSEDIGKFIHDGVSVVVFG